MNETFWLVIGALAVGVTTGPLVWWTGCRVLGWLAWRVEFGRAWSPHGGVEDLQCVSCGTVLWSDELACSGCGKSRELAFLAAIRELEIAQEKLVGLARAGLLGPNNSIRLESALNRQREQLHKLRKPKKPNSSPEMVLTSENAMGAKPGYIDPETFHESYHPGRHPLKLRPVPREAAFGVPPGKGPELARWGGLALLIMALGVWLQGFLPLGVSFLPLPPLGLAWLGLTGFLGSLFLFAFGNGSAILARFAAVLTGLGLPIFWLAGPWMAGIVPHPSDWAMGLSLGVLSIAGAALLEKQLRLARESHFGEEAYPFWDISLLRLSWFFLCGFETLALAGLANLESPLAPFCSILGGFWGGFAFLGHHLASLALRRGIPHFSLTRWLFEFAFGLCLVLSAMISQHYPTMGVGSLCAFLTFLGVSLSGILGHLFPRMPRLLKPGFVQGGSWLGRVLILLMAAAWVVRTGVDPWPWVGCVGLVLVGLGAVGLGGVFGSVAQLLLGNLGVGLGVALMARQIQAELHHDRLEQFWLGLGGFALGSAIAAQLGRITERIAHPQRSVSQVQTFWLRLVPVQILLAGGGAALILALKKQSASEVHFWINPATALAWVIAVVGVIQVRPLRAHGLSLLSLSGAIILWGAVEKETQRGALAIQAGLAFLGLCGFLLSVGVGRRRPMHRRLSKVSVLWSAVLTALHFLGVIGLVVFAKSWNPLPPREIILIPGLLGGLTWMCLARHRNLPGLAWFGAFWILSAFLFQMRLETDTPDRLALLAFAGLMVATLMWQYIVTPRLLPRRFPLGLFLVGALGPVSLLCAGLESFQPTPLAWSLPLLGIVVWVQTQRLATPSIYLLSGLSVLGAFLLGITQYLGTMVEANGYIWPVLALSAWVFTAPWVSWLALPINPRWEKRYSMSASFHAALGMLASLACLALVATSQEPLQLAIFASLPFVLALSGLFPARWPGSLYGTSFSLVLCWVAWQGLGITGLKAFQAVTPSAVLAWEAVLAVVAAIGLSLLSPGTGRGSQVWETVKRSLQGLSLFSAFVCLACLLVHRGQETAWTHSLGWDLATGICASLLAVIHGVCLGWLVNRSTPGYSHPRVPSQFGSGWLHGSYASAFLVLAGALFLGLYLPGNWSARHEMVAQILLVILALVAGVLRGDSWQWLARSWAWTTVLLLGLGTFWNLALWIAANIEKQEPFDVVQGHAPLLTSAVCWALIGAFLHLCRPLSSGRGQGPHPWGHQGFALCAWLGATIGLPVLLIEQGWLSREPWEQAAGFLLVPLFGSVAWWARGSAQPGSASALEPTALDAERSEANRWRLSA